MINISVVKYGSAYTCQYVNDFYEMLKSKTTIPFTFWVHTEYSDGLNPEFKIIPIDKVDPVGRRYHKLDLFETDLLVGKNFNFDLDIIINKNIDHYLQYTPQKLTLLLANYKDKTAVRKTNIIRKTNKDGLINSSVFCWNSGCDSVKQILKTHYASVPDKYNGSLDNFIFWECNKHIQVFPFRDYHSYRKEGYNKDQVICLFSQRLSEIYKFL